MKNMKKLLIPLMVVIMAVSVFSGCKSREDAPAESSSSTSSSSASSKPKPADDADKKISDVVDDMTDEVQSKKTENSDTVGWLSIPELAIADVVVCNYEDNDYYRRRNFLKQDEFNGVLYADRRSAFGNFTAGEIGVNTCIYGHTMTNIDTNPEFNVFFGPLFHLRDQAIAKKVPYLFFSTEKENLVYEVFAVFIANTDNPDLPYNRNDLPPEEFREMVRTEVLPRSLYNYDVEIDDDDKFLTLSTCLYRLPDNTPIDYKTTRYRYAIMAKLVDNGEPLKTEAQFTLNPNPIIDPDGPIAMA